jgi:hypothetical protein
MKLLNLLSVAVVSLASCCVAHAADLTGHWTSEFDSQIGKQKYAYDFTKAGAEMTGKATYDHQMGKGEAPLSDIKVTGDDVAFTEVVKFDGNELTIKYTGKISGDEMKLTRQVGEFATEQIVATRVSAPASKPAESK